MFIVQSQLWILQEILVVPLYYRLQLVPIVSVFLESPVLAVQMTVSVLKCRTGSEVDYDRTERGGRAVRILVYPRHA